jgi:hypothetical protein
MVRAVRETEEKGLKAFVKKLKEENAPINLIMKVTGLSEEEIKDIIG